MPEYIEREALLDDIEAAKENSGMGAVVAGTLMRYIKRQPAADVEPMRHGKWLIKGGRRFCSVCLERACVTRDMEDFWYTKGTNYCPNCGAKMDLEDKQ